MPYQHLRQRSPSATASPLTAKIENEIYYQQKQISEKEHRKGLKVLHKSRSTLLKQNKFEALKELRQSKGTPEFNQRFQKLSQIKHNLEEMKKREFGNNRTYPNHPDIGDKYILLSDLENPKYADVLPRLISARVSNSKFTRKITGRDKAPNKVRVEKLVGDHKELIRIARNYSRGGRTTRKRK